MTLFRIIDCETTGLEETDKVVEIASLDYNDDPAGMTFHNILHDYIDPGVPIPAKASAIHHITDDMVFNAPGFAETIVKYEGAETYVAHNNRFDMKFLGTMGGQWIDTYRVALHVLDDAPGHSLQVLRYHLKLKPFELDFDYPVAHTALGDIAVTAALFDYFINQLQVSPESMIAMSSQPALLKSLPFGKWAQKPIEQVPYSYLQWILAQDFDEDVKHTAKHYIDNGAYKGRGRG